MTSSKSSTYLSHGGAILAILVWALKLCCLASAWQVQHKAYTPPLHVENHTCAHVLTFDSIYLIRKHGNPVMIAMRSLHITETLPHHPSLPAACQAPLHCTARLHWEALAMPLATAWSPTPQLTAMKQEVINMQRVHVSSEQRAINLNRYSFKEMH
jgi:hypothetical protein